MEVRREDMEGGRRLMSLDALRGFDMFWIIGGAAIVNAAAKGAHNDWLNTYILPQLKHVPWEGFSFMDLIMPLFLFIVGAAMPFSFGKRLSHDDRKWRLYLHVVWRCVILFVLGMAAQGHLLDYDLSRLRIYCNTLQAIAAGYLIASFVILYMGVLGQIAATGGLLLLFWGLLILIPVPGHGVGVLEPKANLALYIDNLVLGDFGDGTTYTWILSSMTFATTIILGCFAGQLLRSDKRGISKFFYLLLLGAGTLGLGYMWGRWFPIIKHIWTSSFVLYSGGMCYLLLAMFYLIIDVLGFRLWAYGFVVIGMNAIAVYMATSLFDFRIIGDIFLKGASSQLGDWHGFARAVAGFMVVWLILWWMYRKKSFVKI